MTDKILSSLILLTYKNKALLMHKQNSVIDAEKHPWSFISGVKDSRETFENAMIRRVHKEMGIDIKNVEFVSNFCYHAELTDDNVNSIKRSENQLLDFFNLTELRKLFLSFATEQFVLKHSALI